MSAYEKVGEWPFGGVLARAAVDGAWVLIREGRVDLERIETWSKVQHPNLVPIHGVTEDGCVAHVLFEAIPFAQLRPPKPQLILADVLDALAALEAVRPMSVVHGSIAREQVVVGFDGRARLLGPGIGGAPAIDRIAVGEMFASLFSGKLRWLADRARGALPDAPPFASARAMKAALRVLSKARPEDADELRTWMRPKRRMLDRFAKLGAFEERTRTAPPPREQTMWHPLIADLEITELEMPWPR